LNQEAHRTLHTFGKVPVLEDGDFTLYEVQAILRYLDRVLPDPPLTPSDAKAAARMDQAMNINDWYLFQGCGSIITFQRVVGPRLMGLQPDEAAIAAAMPRAYQVFAELSRLLGDKPFFAGNDASLADLMLAPHFDFFSETPEWSLLTVSNSNLVAWMDRVKSTPAMSATTWAKVEAMARVR
jgi:glutathione S-transferase